MSELKEICNSCASKRNIVEIEKIDKRETIKLSCGHSIVKLELSESLCLSERLMAKHFDNSYKLQRKYSVKKSGKTRKPARDRLTIDRKNRKIIHRVWEQDKNGNWELVHDEKKPFQKKRRR